MLERLLTDNMNTKKFTVTDPGHTYTLSDGTEVEFIKRQNGELIHDGTTNEELIEVLLDRMEFLNEKFPCLENIQAIKHLASALEWLNKRTALRTAQGVETKDIAHVSESNEKYVLVKTSRCYYGGPAHAYTAEHLEADTLERAIALAKAQHNPVGYDVYLEVPKGTVALHPVWSYNTKASYQEAVDQLDPLHDGV